VGDHLLVGARPTTGAAEFFALDPATGSLRSGSPFAGAIGRINTTASVDYARAQVYFASLEFAAGQPSLWCLKLTAGGIDTPCWNQTSPAGITGGPVERNGTVYVGDDLGQVWAFDAVVGTPKWPGPYALCGGGLPIKSYVLADRLGTAEDLYYATSAQLCAARDQGGTVATKWSLSSIPGPTAPVLVRIGAVAYVYVGSSDGRLYQVEADTAAITSVLLRTGATIGAPAFDFRDNMIYVGSDAGAIYAVQVPLP
jgi:outer membrane protein assembly factor BamB